MVELVFPLKDRYKFSSVEKVEINPITPEIR